jgi:hypothetical protein
MSEPSDTPVSWRHLHHVLDGVTKLVREHVRDRTAALEKRVAELEARPQLAYRGVWSEQEEYTPGDLVTLHGSMFYCRAATRNRPGASVDWQMCVKRGRDAS